MNQPRKNVRLYVLLGTAAVLTAALGIDQWLGQRGPEVTVAADVASRPTVRNAVPAGSGGHINPASGISIDDFHDIDDRPLFNPARQRVPSAEEAATAIPGAADGFALGDAQLVGLVSSPGHRFAVLRRKAGGQIVRLEEGQAFDGWTLSEVAARQALFQKDGVRQSLKLFRTPESPPAAALAEFPGGVPPERAIIPTDTMLGVSKKIAP